MNYPYETGKAIRHVDFDLFPNNGAHCAVRSSFTSECVDGVSEKRLRSNDVEDCDSVSPREWTAHPLTPSYTWNDCYDPKTRAIEKFTKRRFGAITNTTRKICYIQSAQKPRIGSQSTTIAKPPVTHLSLPGFVPFCPRRNDSQILYDVPMLERCSIPKAWSTLRKPEHQKYTPSVPPPLIRLRRNNGGWRNRSESLVCSQNNCGTKYQEVKSNNSVKASLGQSLSRIDSPFERLETDTYGRRVPSRQGAHFFVSEPTGSCHNVQLAVRCCFCSHCECFCHQKHISDNHKSHAPPRRKRCLAAGQALVLNPYAHESFFSGYPTKSVNDLEVQEVSSTIYKASLEMNDPLPLRSIYRSPEPLLRDCEALSSASPTHIITHSEEKPYWRIRKQSALRRLSSSSW